MPSPLERESARLLAGLQADGLRREIRPAAGVDFASNDYLGLRKDPRVLAAARDALAADGLGAGAARLLRGDHGAHRRLEARFRALQEAEDALLFPSGFHANYGILQSLGIEGWTIVSDRSNHASIIDGCRAARARTVVVPHNDVDAFARAVQSERTLVVTESVFSMSGDRAPLEALTDLCERTRAALVVDEAHAVGLLPPAGRALLRINPCGKALGGAGAVVTGPRSILDLLRSRCRTFLFTTALPPSVAAGLLAALDICEQEPRRAERALSLARRLDPDAESCIVPVPCESNEHALRAEARLARLGYDVRCVRPPTVPVPSLRISVHADRSDEEVEGLREALEPLR